MKTVNDIPKLKEKIVQKKAEVGANQASIGIYENSIQDLNKQLDKMRQDNPVVAQREDIQSKVNDRKGGGIVMFVVAALALISLVFTYKWILVLILTVLAAAALIYFGIRVYSKHKEFVPELERLNEELKDYDVVAGGLRSQIKGFEKDIKSLRRDIEKLEEGIEKLSQELKIAEKYAPFAKNYALVFVGERHSKENRYTPIANKIYIDDKDYGRADMPFKPIELEPGLHTIKAVVKVHYGEEDHYIESQVSQFRVDKESQIFAFYLNREPKVSTRTFDEFEDFFEFTKQNP